MEIGFAMTGSFCTYQKVFPVLRTLADSYHMIPIFSQTAQNTCSRFGTSEDFYKEVRAICGRGPIETIEEAEPIGPKKLLDALIIAPCTGNTLAKLRCSIADGPVTMAAKSHLRNGRPILIAISTNDALAGAAENIGHLLGRKHYYFVPFRQDSPFLKPTSLVADFETIPEALKQMLEGKQIQPLLLGSPEEERT